MHKKNISLPAIRFNFGFIFYDSSVENNWFGKKKSEKLRIISEILSPCQNLQETD